MGKVSATKEAAGPTEEWTICKASSGEGFALQNYLEKFLKVETGSGRVRADLDSVGPSETIYIKCQRRELDTAAQKVFAEESLEELESREAY